MLDKPQYGWTHIHLHDMDHEFNCRASYLTDVPNDVIEALILFFKYHVPTAVYFDAEGFEYHILFTRSSTFVISDFNIIKYGDNDCTIIPDDEYCPWCTYFNCNIEDIAKEVIADIETNINEWSYWNFNEYNDDIINIEKNKLKKNLEELKNLVSDYLTTT